ncbi:FUSC family protein [Kribbella sp. NPDC050820]|uniref:FUSC family protein n=1 Tax=Kribbella sp. NPDC050820 TaxID=3155408 RepID=UPI0033EACE94
MPTDTTRRALTAPVVLYAVIRAVALAGAVAVAFGLDLPYADWMPPAAMVAMKADLHQSTLAGTQRVVGTILGAAIAAVFLLSVDDKHVLEVVILVLAVIGGSLRFVNYALYTTAIAGTALIALDLANPIDLATEGKRILFTLLGIAIAVTVTILARLIQRRAANRQPSA